jgi:hypothetical protein
MILFYLGKIEFEGAGRLRSHPEMKLLDKLFPLR